MDVFPSVKVRKPTQLSRPMRLQFTFPHFPDEKTVNELLTENTRVRAAAAPPTCAFRNTFATMCINSLESRTLWIFNLRNILGAKFTAATCCNTSDKLGGVLLGNVPKAPVWRDHQVKETECKPGQGSTHQSLFKCLALFCAQSHLYWTLDRTLITQKQLN